MNKPVEKTVAITGAGKGLGAAYAKYLACNGMNVLVNNRIHKNQKSSAEQIVEEIRSMGGNASANHSSIEDPNSGKEILEQCLDEFGSFDYLINNAGVAEGKTFHQTTLQDFNEIISINFTGAVNVSHACFQHMYENDFGSILFTTSGAGLFGQHGMPAYSSSKAGLIGLAHSLHLEAKTKNLNINVLSPFAFTNMTKNFLTTSQKQQFTTDKVTPIVKFLLESQRISGNIFIAGGGQFKIAKMIENTGIDLSALNQISDVEIDNNLQSLMSLEEVVTREDASESFEALER
ncbi:MAG: SDR family NAD(P)-dependent oxidoreductase [Candidatus Neomarinimicrobiota bacterium]